MDVFAAGKMAYYYAVIDDEEDDICTVDAMKVCFGFETTCQSLSPCFLSSLYPAVNQTL